MDPDGLLDAWRASYTSQSRDRRRFYTALHGREFEDASRVALRTEGASGRIALASFSAANWLAPYLRTSTHYFVADSQGLRHLQKTLRLAPVSQGENVMVTLVKDSDLPLDTVEPAPGAICTNPIQTYLDLAIAGEQGAEAAEHLRREALAWPKKT